MIQIEAQIELSANLGHAHFTQKSQCANKMSDELLVIDNMLQ